MPEEWQESLTLSAQTLFIPKEQERWDDQLRELAAFLSRERQCGEWLRLHERKVRRMKEQVNAAVGEDRCMVLRLSGDTLYAYCNRGIRDVLYEQLGLTPAYSPDETSGTLYNEPVTFEELARLNPQRLLLLICPDSPTRVSWLSLQHSAGWRDLQAVRSSQVYLLPSDPWFEYSAVAVDRMLDEMLLMFTGICPNPHEDGVHGYPAAYPL
ncbi:HTH-type transcriptional activator Btr [compost metagenome]